MRGEPFCAPTGVPPCSLPWGDMGAGRCPGGTAPFRTARRTWWRDHIGAAQNLLYRLTGDTNLVHVDRAVAVSRGLDGPFVHDLCAYGYACRLAIAGLFPGQPERLRRMYAAMKTVLYPDTPVELHLWKLAPGRAAFRLCHGTTGKAILDRGELEWDEVV